MMKDKPYQKAGADKLDLSPGGGASTTLGDLADRVPVSAPLVGGAAGAGLGLAGSMGRVLPILPMLQSEAARKNPSLLKTLGDLFKFAPKKAPMGRGALIGGGLATLMALLGRGPYKGGTSKLKEACDSTGLTPYQLTFAIRVHEANLSPRQIEAGIEKAGEYMGEEYVEELREGMDKIASMDKEAIGWLRAGWHGLKAGAPKVTNWLKAMTAAPGKSQASRVGAVMNRIAEPGKTVGSTVASLKGASKPLGLLGGQGQGFKSGLGGALRMGIGAQTGSTMAGEDAPWYVRAPLMLGGAAIGRAMPNMGAGAQAMGRRAMWGGWGGMTADQMAALGGIDTGGRFGQLGALGGFASPLLRGQAIPGAVTAGKYNPLARLAGKNLPNLGYTLAPGAARGSAQLGGLGKKISDAVTPGWRSGLGWGMFAPTVGAAAAGGAQGLAGAADRYVDSKVDRARQDTMNELMNNPQVQSALEMANKGGGFMDSLSGIANIVDPILEMIGIDPSQMNPLMKILLMAGGGLGIGGLLSGSKGAGIGGLGMMAIPLLAQAMKGQGANPSTTQRALGPGGMRGVQGNFVDPNRVALGIEDYVGSEGGLGEQTEFDKARGVKTK